MFTKYTEYSSLTLAASSAISLSQDTIMWRDTSGFDDPSSFFLMTFQTARDVLVLPLFGTGVAAFLLTPTLTTLGDILSADVATLSGNLFTDPQSAPNFVVECSTISYVNSSVSAMQLDFNGSHNLTCMLSGAGTFASSFLDCGKSLTVRLSAATSVPCYFNFPSWTFVGNPAPTSLEAFKQALLVLDCFGTSESDVTARYFASA